MAKFLDFIAILLTNNNLENGRLTALLSQFWGGPLVFMTVFFYVKVVNLRRKLVFLAIYIVIGFLFELLLFIYPESSLTFSLPSTPGGDMITYGYNFNFLPIALIVVIFGLTGIGFGGFGFLFKGFKSKSIIRRKYFFLSTGFFIYSFLAVVDTLDITSPIFNLLVKGGLLSSDFFLYYGLREEQIKQTPQKKIQVEDSLFRLYERPDLITEEEIMFYKDKKICLVCKGSATGFNIYVCPNCDALYCQNCATGLSGYENACWMCNTPFDKSKPSKPYITEKREVSEKK
jgi:hypothetical protein